MKSLLSLIALIALTAFPAVASANEVSCSSTGHDGDTCTRYGGIPSQGFFTIYYYVWEGNRWVLERSEICNGTTCTEGYNRYTDELK